MKSKKEQEAEAARLELAASVERAKAQELAAAEAKALLIEEKKRSDELFALEDTSTDIAPAQAPKGFKVQGFEVMLYGICPQCG